METATTTGSCPVKRSQHDGPGLEESSLYKVRGD